jgi:ABC-type enterochelin transport system permease subunit
MRGILVNIMVELLAVLALAMQQIKQGRFSEFMIAGTSQLGLA